MGAHTPPPAKTFTPVNPVGQADSNSLFASSPVAQAPPQTTFSPETWSTLPGLKAAQTTTPATTKKDPFAPFGDYYDWSQGMSGKLGMFWGMFPEDKRKQFYTASHPQS